MAWARSENWRRVERIDTRSPSRRQGKGKSCPSIDAAVVDDDPAAMSFDNRAANRQADAHAGFLSGEKTIEQARHMLGAYARAAILDDAAQSDRVGSGNAYGQLPQRPFGMHHGMDSIDR